tara:strand:+ start:413 stop:895 length:483 start_codon:yes stop_codon:yes gene_type:complete
MNSQVKKINKAIKEKPLVIIAYLMEGCGWCEKLKPEWKKVKKNKNYLYEIVVSKNNPNILEGLDCDTSDTNGGFPCICIYKNGKKSKCHSGYRDEAALIKLINNASKQSGGSKYKRTSKTKRKSRKTKRNKTKKKRRRKRSKARSAFYKKLNKKLKKKKK